MFKLVRALREHGVENPWRVAWTCFKSQWLPHRTHLFSDSDGFVYDPMIRQWNIGKWQIWEDSRERKRQLAKNKL